MNFFRVNRGAVLVFLSAFFAGCIWASGCVGVVSSAANSSPDSQSASAALVVTPTSVSVATVVGTTGSQTVTATNIGTSSVAINQVTVTGAGFRATGLSVPANVGLSLIHI